MKQTLFLLIIVLNASMQSWAYDYDAFINGIYYNLNYETKEAEVTLESFDTLRYSGDVVIPESVELDGVSFSVKSIGWAAFENCTGLTSIIIPESVKSIGSSAFWGCTGLSSINIPESVTSIDRNVFGGCTGLYTINIPESVTSIGYGAFYGCTSLATINIPESVTIIGGESFKGCSGLQSIEIPESVTIIEGDAFSGCSDLTSVTIPESVTRIDNYAFAGCVRLPVEDGIRYADTYAVEAVDNKRVSHCLKDGTRFIGNAAFADCKLMSSFTIPETVISIGSRAFEDCTGMTSIYIPETVTSIGYSAFEGCTGLTEITSLNLTPPSTERDCFKNVLTSSCMLKVPVESIEAYKSAENWKDFFNIVGLSEEEYLALSIEYIDSPTSKLNFAIHFNLDGRLVGEGYKGIVVKDGRKFLRK